MIVKLLTEHYLEFLSLTGGCTGLYESTLVKMPHCWKSRHGSNWVKKDKTYFKPSLELICSHIASSF